MSIDKSRENFLLQAMNKGFLRASHSFSKFLGEDIRVTHTNATLISRNDFSAIPEKKGNLYIMTTQVIGELSGRSYLIFNEEACTNLTKTIKHLTGLVEEQMKEALLIEIDNIISAAVIAELSEALQIEIYGDVPNLKMIPAKEFSEFLLKDPGSTDMNNMLIIDTAFQFSIDKKQMLPRFAWRLSEKVLAAIPSAGLAVK